MGEKQFILECSIDSVESAKAAKIGGADRLELCGASVIGGITPSIFLYELIREKTDLPIHVLIRPRFGDFCYTENECELMCREIKAFSQMGAQGVVIGALKPDGRMDIEKMNKMCTAAGNMKKIMHRAFDVAVDPYELIDQAAELGIDTILTSGQAKGCMEGIETLKKLNDYAKGRVNILAGAGITPENIKVIAKETGITRFHMSGKKIVDSSMIYRKENVPMGLPSFSEYEIYRTDEEKIRKAKTILEQIEKGIC